jgi:hypothetical protein
MAAVDDGETRTPHGNTVPAGAHGLARRNPTRPPPGGGPWPALPAMLRTGNSTPGSSTNERPKAVVKPRDRIRAHQRAWPAATARSLILLGCDFHASLHKCTIGAGQSDRRTYDALELRVDMHLTEKGVDEMGAFSTRTSESPTRAPPTCRGLCGVGWREGARNRAAIRLGICDADADPSTVQVGHPAA